MNCPHCQKTLPEEDGILTSCPACGEPLREEGPPIDAATLTLWDEARVDEVSPEVTIKMPGRAAPIAVGTACPPDHPARPDQPPLLAPREVPAGLMTALAGAPYFLWLLRRTGDRS